MKIDMSFEDIVFDTTSAEVADFKDYYVLPTQLEAFAYPYTDYVTREVSLVSALCFGVRHNTDTSKLHNVVVSYCKGPQDEDRFMAWCGDAFLEGKLDQAKRDLRIKSASALSWDAAAAAAELQAQSGGLNASTACNFWALVNKGKVCKHVKHVVYYMQQPALPGKPGFGQFEKMLKDKYAQLMGQQNEPSGAASATTKGVEPFTLLEHFAFKVPVLVEGDRGSGKTFEARKLARQEGFHRVEYGCHAGTETIDLLGHLVRLDAEAMIWKDGPLTEAFRKAQKGKTVLILDEILRMGPAQTSIFLTALTPDEGQYRLRTGRVISVVDGVAQEEELSCSVENLWVIATTNVGEEYGVDMSDPAFAERFVLLRKDTNEADTRNVLEELVQARGWSDKLVNKCVLFLSRMEKARTQGLMHRAPTMRTLARAISTLAATEAQVPQAIKAQALLWVARTSDGRPVKEQLDDIGTMVKTIFK